MQVNKNFFQITLSTNCEQDDHLPDLLEDASNISQACLSNFFYKRWNNASLRDFISTTFSGDVLQAYDILKPLAYKADLGRLCLLHAFGGWYADISLKIISPLLSQVPGAKFSDGDISALTNRIQFGGDEVVKAKDGAGSATLSMAYAGQRFASRLLEAMSGQSGVVECTFVENDLTPAKFFSTPCRLGPNGVEEVLPFGKLSSSEQATLDAMIPDLQAQAQKGIDFVKNN